MAKYLDNVGTAYLIEKIKEMSVKTIEPNDQYLKDFAQGVYQATAGGSLFYTTQDDEVTVSVGDIISINIEDSNVHWVIIGNGHQYWGTANDNGTGTINEGDKSPIVAVNSIDNLEPTPENYSTMYLYNRQLYKWYWVSSSYTTNTRYRLLNPTTGALVTVSSSYTWARYCYASDFISIESKMIAYANFQTDTTVTDAGYFLGLCYYDENQTFISSTTLQDADSNTVIRLTNVPTNAKYVRFSYYDNKPGFYNAEINKYAVQQNFLNANRIYATDSDKEQTTLPYGTGATANYVVQRITGGQITVPTTPSATTDATSKSYVDKHLTTITELFSGSTSQGSTITLSQAVTNFKWVMIESCEQSNGGKIIVTIPVNELPNHASAWDAIYLSTDSQYHFIYYVDSTHLQIQAQSGNFSWLIVRGIN